MGDWKPEKTETMTVDGTEYKIHLWTITEKEKEKIMQIEKELEKTKEKEKKPKE
jgi:hypothetical protein